MERDVVAIYKGIDGDTKAKVDKVKEEIETRLHDIADEHHDAIVNLVKGLTDEEFAVLLKSEGLEMIDKMMILAAHEECQVEE